ncbi:uncharacterized protein [Branchiostoma lanceolatum]|uniref:uncharacterized protein n=1 Tax=Branchiostoma lanceolatum TaxID=7740 RepID=UPI0034549C98
MAKQTDDVPDEMPLYSMVNKRQKYSDDSSDFEKNNLTRASRLSSRDNGNPYATPTRERPANNSYGYGNLQTFGGRDNRAFDWKPTVKNVPVNHEYKLPRARLSTTSTNQW